MANRQPQVLPIHLGTLAGRPIRIELARTDRERAIGMMFRTEIASDTGMLFCYSSPRMMTFWMKNTRVPLDILFFDARLRIVDIIEGMVPGWGRPEPILERYSSRVEAQYALELAAGAVASWGLRLGDRLELPLTLLFDGSP